MHGVRERRTRGGEGATDGSLRAVDAQGRRRRRRRRPRCRRRRRRRHSRPNLVHGSSRERAAWRLLASAIDSFPNRIRSGEYSPRSSPTSILLSSSSLRAAACRPSAADAAGCRRERRAMQRVRSAVARDAKIITSRWDPVIPASEHCSGKWLLSGC